MVGATSRLRQAIGIALGVLTLVASAGCSTTVQGRAAAVVPGDGEPPLNAAPGPPDPEDIIIAPEDGRTLEAYRLAAATPIIPTVFPDRTESCFPDGAFYSTENLETLYFLEGTAKPTLDKYGFAAGWGECQQDVDSRGTLSLSVELSDPASARAAVAELAKAGQDFDERTSTVLDGYPVQTSSDGENDKVEIWAPVGRTMAYVHHTAPIGQALDGATRMVIEHVRLLEAFTPTPQAELPNLPIDPAGLAPRVVTLPGEIHNGTGPYELESYLRLAIDAKVERDLLAGNGFESMYYVTAGDDDLSYSVSLYKFPGSAQTNVVYDGFSQLEDTKYGGTRFRLPSIPDAPCFVFDASIGTIASFYQRCYVGFGGYLASVDVGGMESADDTAKMDELLPKQRDLIKG
jgi:hypothetical protein